MREGSNGPAVIQVTLINEGADAFQPELYGDRIIIERRITKGGTGGGYCLMKADKTVSYCGSVTCILWLC